MPLMVILQCLTNQHDGNFLPGRKQLQAQALGYRDQAMLIVSVESVTFLKLRQP